MIARRTFSRSRRSCRRLARNSSSSGPARPPSRRCSRTSSRSSCLTSSCRAWTASRPPRGSRSSGHPLNVPIIFLTAAGADPELAFRGYAAGAVDYISKPFDPWVLRAKVSVFVDLYLKERQLRVVSDLPSLLSAIEEAAAGLAGLPALASGALTDTALADGLARLDGAIASLRSTIGGLGVESAEARHRLTGRRPHDGPARAAAASRPRCARGRSSRARPPPRTGQGQRRGPRRPPRPPRCGRSWRQAG